MLCLIEILSFGLPPSFYFLTYKTPCEEVRLLINRFCQPQIFVTEKHTYSEKTFYF